MGDQHLADVRTWLDELCEAGVRASLSIGGERLGAFFAGMEDGDAVVMDVVVPSSAQLRIDSEEDLVVGFRDPSRTGSWRFTTRCRQSESMGPGRMLLYLDVPSQISSAEQRTAVRAAVSGDTLQAAIWLAKRRRPARVLDISASGAKLHIAPHSLRIADAQPGAEFTIEFFGPAVQAVSRGQRQSTASVRRIVRDEPPWVLGIELISPPGALVAALAECARQAHEA